MSEIKPYSRYSERVMDLQQKKRLKINLRLTTRIKGVDKNNFIDDCMLRGQVEAELFRSIVKLHYDLLKAFPQLKGREFRDIRDFLIDLHK